MKNENDSSVLATPEYRRFIEDLKARVISARISAARAVNRDGILLYWDIGRAIVEKQKVLGWGDAVVEMVSADLRREFPQMKGFSPRNVWYMRRLFEVYGTGDFLQQAVAELPPVSKQAEKWRQPVAKIEGGNASNQFLQQVVAEIGGETKWPQAVAKLTGGQAASFLPQLVAEIPWGHHVLILDKLSAAAARLWYLQATARFGWTRNVLLNQIKAGAFERAVTEKKSHNFPLALPEHLAEQADEMLKSSYNLEFLGIRQAVKERELENRLIERLRDFILELGYGFCFVGRQHRLTLGKKEYFIDLLFYHRFLRALVAFDLKVGPFEPEHAGKMDFYLNLLNDKERAPEDRPSIGIILCAEKDDVEVEYALRAKRNPIGVAVYELQPKLPAAFKGKLPTAKQLADVVRSVLPERSGK
ncbi:MAG: DUF1016 domain-containing protein [Verrucomicrobia bacterium]|nr:DUF1016 domain-containing protein [Verrucomicrobiota bacterium]